MSKETRDRIAVRMQPETRRRIEQWYACLLYTSNIELCPLSRATIAGNSTFRELLRKTLVRILAASHGLGHSKDKIWDTKEVLKYRIGAKTVTAYSGVRLALLFDNKYSYLTLVPSFMYADDAVLTREGKKQFAD